MRRRWLAAGFGLAMGYVGCSTTTTSPSVEQGFLIGQGAYLVKNLVDCGGCHTADPTKPFAGGVQFPIDGAGHFVTSRNLTGMKLTEEQFIKVMQTGEDFTNPGQALIVMPWPNFRWMSTDDLRSIYAFLQVLPASDNTITADNKGPAALIGPVPMPTQYNEGEETRPLPPLNAPVPLGAPDTPTTVPDPGHAALGGAIFPLSYAKMPNFYKRTAQEQAAFGRGSYLVNAAACGDCHTNKGGAPRIVTPGPDFLKIPADSYLTGGTTYPVPAALNARLGQTRTMSSNLVGKSGFFNEDKTSFLLFSSIIDAMAHTDDSPPLPIGWPMPADHFRGLSQTELTDIYTYMRIIAQDYDHKGQVDKATQGQARYCTATSDCQAGETCFVDSSADKRVNNQCVGKACMDDSDCGACQKCTSKKCKEPAGADACLGVGL